MNGAAVNRCDFLRDGQAQTGSFSLMLATLRSPIEWLKGPIQSLRRHDLALSKTERNIQRDRDDVQHLARTAPSDLAVLKDRYQNEPRRQLGNPEREDLTLRLWIEG
jgi:hypothetical protein